MVEIADDLDDCGTCGRIFGKHREGCPEDVDDAFDIGTCQGCGGYGKVGDTCIRKIDGEMQECGEYI